MNWNLTDQPNAPKARFSHILLAVVFSLVLTACVTAWQLYSGHQALSQNPEFQYLDSAVPMLTNHDGYYYLRLAQNLADDAYAPVDELRDAPRPQPAPLLSRVTTLAAKQLKRPVQEVALYAPPVLAWLTVLVLLAWGLAASGPVAAITAALAGALCPFWYKYTHVGKFDTDCLIPFFLYLCAYLSFRFTTLRTLRRWIHLLLFGLATYAFYLWWRPGLALSGLFLLMYSLTPFLPSTNKERACKLLLLGVIGVTIGLTANNRADLLPAPLGAQAAYAYEHFQLIFRLTPDAARAADSVVELKGLTLPEMANDLSGHMAVFIASLAGLGILFLTRFKAALFLIPMVALGAAGLYTNRFLILSFPVAALGLGVLIKNLTTVLRQAFNPPLNTLGPILLALAALFPMAWADFHETPAPRMTRSLDILAQAAAEHAKPDTIIWTWWDYAYFLQFRAKLPTFYDGGFQTTDNCFVSAFPLVCDNPLLARNWIRFFAAHGRDEFVHLTKTMGSKQAATDFLVQALSLKTSLHTLAKEYPLDWAGDLKTYLFPDPDVLVLLPPHMLKTHKHWMAYGSLHGPYTVPFGGHINIFPNTGFTFPEDTATAILSARCQAKGYTTDPTLNDKNHTYIPSIINISKTTPTPLYFATHTPPYLLHSPTLPNVYILDTPMALSTALPLLTPILKPHPYFTPLAPNLYRLN